MLYKLSYWTKHERIGGSVVESSPATRGARVRFPANAFIFALSCMLTLLGGVRNYRKLKSFRTTYKVCLTHPLDRSKKFLIYHISGVCNRSASGIVPFESDANVCGRSTAFHNTLDDENQTITSKVTLFLVITTICERFVISVIFSSVIDPPTQIRRYYGMILTFDNCGHSLTG